MRNQITLNWSKQENARRIAKSLVRYEYIDETLINQIYLKLLQYIAVNDLSVDELRKLTHFMSRNVNENIRDRTSAKMLRELKRIKRISVKIV